MWLFCVALQYCCRIDVQNMMTIIHFLTPLYIVVINCGDDHDDEMRDLKFGVLLCEVCVFAYACVHIRLITAFDSIMKYVICS